MTKRFEAKLQPVEGGGLYVTVPAKVAEAVGLKRGVRVRGALNGAPYRSSLMVYEGVVHLGVHKATAEAAEAKPGDRVQVEIELDDEPLPTDVVPPDLKRALSKLRGGKDAWEKLAPSKRREKVKGLLDAKKPETRERRLAAILVELGAKA